MAKKKIKKHSVKLGLPPGAVIHIGERTLENAVIDLIDYNLQVYNARELKTVEESFPFKDTPTVTWLNIQGLHNTDLVQKIGKNFDIHPLIIEDILNTEQRPKVEIFDNHIFIVLKMFTYDTENQALQKEQVSFLLGKHFVICFQERSGDVFGPVRERIKSSLGRIRKTGPDYLLYSLIDVMIDHYFLVLENISDEIEDLENIVLINPDRHHLQQIHILKREIIELRKSVWPVREIIGNLQREESNLIKDTTQPYLRDLYDHILNVSDTIESMREMVGSLLETYLTNISNRMNEVMKVLTIISTIFIPLSFLAGVYGMNFEFIPELKWQWGYFTFWGFALVIFGSMIYYFRRKKWF